MKKVLVFLLAAFWCFTDLAIANGFKCETGSKTCVINIASQTPAKDEKTAGPKKIIVKGANTLRYDYVFNPAVTFTAGPSIDLFTLGTSTGVAPKAGVQAMTAQVTGASPDLESAAQSLIQSANTATRLVNEASTDMQNLLTTSDSILRAGGDASGEAALKQEIHNRQKDPATCPNQMSDISALSVVFQRGVCAIWPDLSQVDQILSQAKNLKSQLQDAQKSAQSKINDIDAKLSPDSASAETKSLLTERKTHLQDISAADDLLKRLDPVITQLADIAADGKKYKDFSTLLTNLRKWNQRMIALDHLDHPFTLPPQPAPCGFAFSKTKTIKEELARTDLFASTAAASDSGSASKSSKDSSAVTTIPLITVECTSPFSLSAGVAFSGIIERDFLIQPVPNSQNSTTTTNRFTTDAHSNFHPLPVALVNVRYYEFNDFLSLHGSFGVAANIKGQSAGGSDPEYLFSPITLGFFRTAFLTPALHIGREVRLGSGFHEGDVVPPNITTPPLQKSYKPTFAVAITFTKP
jgi:hypothetical protein